MAERPEVGCVEFEQPKALIEEIVSQRKLLSTLNNNMIIISKRVSNIEESARTLKEDEIDNWTLHNKIEDQEKRLANLENPVVNARP